MDTTPNLGLAKPGTQDKVDITVLDGNWDILDDAVGSGASASFPITLDAGDYQSKVDSTTTEAGADTVVVAYGPHGSTYLDVMSGPDVADAKAQVFVNDLAAVTLHDNEAFVQGGDSDGTDYAYLYLTKDGNGGQAQAEVVAHGTGGGVALDLNVGETAADSQFKVSINSIPDPVVITESDVAIGLTSVDGHAKLDAFTAPTFAETTVETQWTPANLKALIDQYADATVAYSQMLANSVSGPAHFASVQTQIGAALTDSQVSLGVVTGNDGMVIQNDGANHATIGFFGAVPVARPAAPTTLADVIAALQALGLVAT